jgi:hypothetical protein
MRSVEEVGQQPDGPPAHDPSPPVPGGPSSAGRVTVTEDRTGTTSSSRSDRAVAVGVPTLVLALHSAFYGPWIEDDAGITFAYARSLATGAGPVLQPGAEPVEGFSNPLWLAILVVGRGVGLFDHGAWFGVPDLVLFPKLVALGCAAATFAVLFGVACTVSQRPVAVTVAAGTVTALVPSYAIWTTSGLENALYALLVVAVAASLARAAVAGHLLDRRVAVVTGALAGLAALTRPDGLLYLMAYPLVVGLLHADRPQGAVRSSTWSFGAALVPIGTYLVWRLATFGDWLPNTARAKQQGLPVPTDLLRPAELVVYAGWLTVLVGVGAVAMVLTRPSRVRTVVGVLLVPLALAFTTYVVLPPDWMAQHRFATPVWPLGALIMVLAIAATWRCAARRTRAGIAMAGVLAMVVTATGWIDAADTFRRDPTAPLCFIAGSVGKRVNAYADALRVRDGTLLAVDGGGTALSSRLRFVDLSGLADARIAELWQQGDTRGLRDHVFEVVRPTFFKMDSGWSEAARSGLLTDPRLGRDYVLLFAPNPGSGTWVRRDVVPEPESLAQARRRAVEGFTRTDAPFLRGDRTAWICGPRLRPSPS